MTPIIDITYSKKTELPSFDEDDAKKIGQKGWSFSYVYNFSEIRDIYHALRQKSFLGLKDFTDYCLEIKLPYVRTKWNQRRILEHLNALKNFDLIGTDYSIKRSVFNSSSIGAAIGKDELMIFEEIYFTYFRFKEIFIWFINPDIADRLTVIEKIDKEYIVKNSNPIFSFSNESRFTDSFF